jgi:hypothetical protein
MGEAARLSRQTNPLPTPDGISTLLARLDSMETNMNKKIDAISHTIDEKLEKLRGDMKEDLKAELFPDIQRNTDSIAAHSNTISDLQRRIQHLEHSAELNSKSNDLIMKGVPMLSRENTTTYYERAARTIGFAANSIPRADVFRLGRKAANSTVGPPILIKFMNKMDKSDFHNKYFKHLNLKLSDLGFESSEERIYISENLTKSCQTIFVEAKKLKREGKMSAVKTSFGAVFVKKLEGDNWMQINEISNLGEL